jgi:hypothetical protein
MKDRDKTGPTPADTIRHQDISFIGDQANNYYSQLRETMREVASSLTGTVVGTRKITTSIGMPSKGEGSNESSKVLPSSTVESLLTSKIVVVAQRDIWEGDYSLFDALTGGALVTMDNMLALPAGLVDGKNVIVYHSREDLEDMLLYYLSPEQEEARLEIASNGYKVAMELHRSFHQMEEIFFGTPLSSYTPSQGPKVTRSRLLLLPLPERRAKAIRDLPRSRLMFPPLSPERWPKASKDLPTLKTGRFRLWFLVRA